MDMVSNDKKYKQVASAIGISLIFMLLLAHLLLSGLSGIVEYLLLPFGETLSYTVSMIVHIFAYLSTFIVPAFVLRKLLKKKGLDQPMRLEFKMSASDLLIIPASIAVCLGASVLNSFIMSFIVSSEIISETAVEVTPYAPYQVVLVFIASALVPAVSEEFLFRGGVASSLMPFGKGVAVVGSALVFALMHQNPYQIFYTFVAGIFLGYIYVKTGSILCSTLLHLFNNSVALIFDLCQTNIGGDFGTVCYYIVMATVFVFGLVSFILYFAIEKRKTKNRFCDGSFGKEIEPCEEYAALPVTHGKKLRYFLAPTMIVYLVLAAGYAFLQAGLLGLVGIMQ